jgi:hypothetical protein
MAAQARDPDGTPPTWRGHVVLKRDVFSTIERGIFRGPSGEIDAVLRRIDQVPWWSWPIAKHFLDREARALKIAGPLGIAPPLLHAGRNMLIRGFIDGVALHLARPIGDRAYFASAHATLRVLHRALICHNDLAKEQNWLRGGNGGAYLTDFQLAVKFPRRTRLFRIAAYEDLRHLLKHKRSYVPEALTAAERRILARKSFPTRIWMATGKRVYFWITRGIVGFTDREGGGPRLVDDAPALVAQLKGHPQVRDVAVVAFPDRRSGTGLYAFVATQPGVDGDKVRDFILGAAGGPKAPEHIQLVDTLPRDAVGRVRTELLQLIAMNQVDLIGPLIRSEEERLIVSRIVNGRQNLRDRFTF